MIDNVINARSLTKCFADRCVVDGVNFSVSQGECLGILGPNGAGKTTLLRMLLGQIIPTAGDLQVLGFTIPAQARQMRAKVGVVPQQDNLDIDFTVIENLRSYASFFGLRHDSLKQRLPLLLNFAALDDRQDERITALSGGMKRRLMLARALVNDPELLFLDEPTTGLDPQARQLLWQRLRRLNTDGTTLILTTHYLEEAERLCDRVFIIDHGRILVSGAPKALIAEHIEPQVVEIYGEGVDSCCLRHEQLPLIRVETVGETIFCYCEDAQAILAYLEAFPQWEYLQRRANLEDVFLKLTGRDLRDG